MNDVCITGTSCFWLLAVLDWFAANPGVLFTQRFCMEDVRTETISVNQTILWHN